MENSETQKYDRPLDTTLQPLCEVGRIIKRKDETLTIGHLYEWEKYILMTTEADSPPQWVRSRCSSINGCLPPAFSLGRKYKAKDYVSLISVDYSGGTQYIITGSFDKGSGAGDGANGVLIDSSHAFSKICGEEKCWVEGPHPVDDDGNPIDEEWRTDMRGRLWYACIAHCVIEDDEYEEPLWPDRQDRVISTIPYVEYPPDDPGEWDDEHDEYIDRTLIVLTEFAVEIDVEVKMEKDTGFLYYDNRPIGDDHYIHFLAIGSKRVTEPEFTCECVDPCEWLGGTLVTTGGKSPFSWMDTCTWTYNGTYNGGGSSSENEPGCYWQWILEYSDGNANPSGATVYLYYVEDGQTWKIDVWDAASN
jgi:hypothetical protein